LISHNLQEKNIDLSNKVNNNNNSQRTTKKKSIKTNADLIIIVDIITVLLLSFIIVNVITIVNYPSNIAVVSAASPSALPIGKPTSNLSNPFGSFDKMPPQIIMVYENKEYHGALLNYIFNNGRGNSTLPSNQGGNTSNITSVLPSNEITVKENSTVKFIVKDNNSQPGVQPNSLSVNAYTIQGKPVKILSLAEDVKSNTFKIDLSKGEYIILATATWLPSKENSNSNSSYLTTTGGHISYNYRINIIN
jgi:hypothetical protein